MRWLAWASFWWGSLNYARLWVGRPWPGLGGYCQRRSWASGIFLLIWSDHEAWPIGSWTLAETLSGKDPEMLQHKIFGILALGVGIVEWVRRTGKLGQWVWSALTARLCAHWWRHAVSAYAWPAPSWPSNTDSPQCHGHTRHGGRISLVCGGMDASVCSISVIASRTKKPTYSQNHLVSRSHHHRCPASFLFRIVRVEWAGLVSSREIVIWIFFSTHRSL